MTEGRDEIVIYPLSPGNLKRKISKIGTALDCEDSIKARKLLSEVKTTLDEKEKSLIRNHNYNHVFLDTMLKIQEGRLFILESSHSGDLPAKLIEGLDLAKKNSFRSLEMLAQFELGKYFLNKCKLDLAMGYLAQSEEQMLLNRDLCLLRSQFLHTRAAHLLELRRSELKDISKTTDLKNIHDALEILIKEISIRGDDQNRLLKKKTIAMLVVAKKIMRRPQHEISVLASSL